MDQNTLWDLGLNTIKELETEKGILASSKEEIFGCIFGRDSLISSLSLLDAYKNSGDQYFLALVKKILLNLADLQGKAVNLESGEEPGKLIHEFRPDQHEHLTKNLSWPWFVYTDNIMRNYDSVDATPLFLIAVHKYYQATGDQEFLTQILPNIYRALDWIFMYGDSNADGFIDYQFHPDRKFGGLRTQSWMDSEESVFHENGQAVAYSIAPVEVQAYTWLALRVWSDFFKTADPAKSQQLQIRAEDLKVKFNEKFINFEDGQFSMAFAIDGKGHPLTASRSSIGHCLWAAWVCGGNSESILETEYFPLLVDRLMLPDLFEPTAGVRTLSSKSVRFQPLSYHNGSIWPHDTAMIMQGLQNFGFIEQASKVRSALLNSYVHFQTPLELFVFDGKHQEYVSSSGQAACRKQAWSAASLLACLSTENIRQSATI